MGDIDAASEIRNIVSRCCQLVDDRRFDELVQCFAPDAELVFDGETFVGHDTLLARWQASPARSGKHLTTNTVVEISGTTATATSDFVYVWADHTLGSMGRYTDQLVLLAGRWVLRRREVALLA